MIEYDAVILCKDYVKTLNSSYTIVGVVQKLSDTRQAPTTSDKSQRVGDRPRDANNNNKWSK